MNARVFRVHSVSWVNAAISDTSVRPYLWSSGWANIKQESDELAWVLETTKERGASLGLGDYQGTRRRGQVVRRGLGGFRADVIVIIITLATLTVSFMMGTTSGQKDTMWH